MARGVLSAVVASALLAAPASAHVPDGARGGGTVFAEATPAETIALRTRYLGAENVDPRTGAVRRDRVILSWFGVTNFVMAIRGHVVLLDAWVPRGAHSGYVPSSPQELAELRPEAIFIGHAHFDHAADAVPIAQASGATIVGSAEQCAELRGRAATMPPRCVEALPAGAPPGTAAAVDALRGVKARIVKHVHSGAKGPGADATGYHVPVTPPPSTTSLDHPPTPEDMAQLVDHAPDAEAGTVLYRFEVGDFSMVWNDSAGPLADDAPEAFDALRALRPVDVQVGAIQGFNQITNGMRDPRQYIEAIQPGLLRPRPPRRLGRGDHHEGRELPRPARRGAREDPGRAAAAGALHRRPHRLRPPAGPHLPGPPRPGPPRAQLRRRRAPPRQPARRPRRRRGGPRRKAARSATASCSAAARCAVRSRAAARLTARVTVTAASAVLRRSLPRCGLRP